MSDIDAVALLAGGQEAFPKAGVAMLPVADGGGADGTPRRATPGCPREAVGLLLEAVLVVGVATGKVPGNPLPPEIALLGSVVLGGVELVATGLEFESLSLELACGNALGCELI